MERDKWLTPDEVAEIIRVSGKTVREWLRKGTLKGVKIGKIWRIREDDLKALLSGGTTVSYKAGRLCVMLATV